VTIDQLIKVLATVTLLEMMVTIGLGVTFAEAGAVARNWRFVGKAALANYVCVPAAAVALLLFFHPKPYVAAGFLIAALCPGAPYGPPFTGMAKGNVATSVGLMLLLAGSSALLAPLLLTVLLPFTLGFLPPLPPDSKPLQIDAFKVVSTLLFSQMLPLCVGLAIRQWRPVLAEKLRKPGSLLSMVLNLATLAVILSAQFDMLIDIPPRGYVGMLVLVAAGVAAGWLLGGPGAGNRTAMTIATSVRNVAVSLVIATASFGGTQAVTAVTAFAVFQTVLMAIVAFGWGRLARSKIAVDMPPDPSHEPVERGTAIQEPHA
jgi:BASS family bile acid:Na+ symporter